MVPRVLIFHTLDWPNAARLAMAFHSASCRVHTLCYRKHPVRALSCVEGLHHLNPFSPLASLRNAIRDAAPDVIVPCDDTAVFHLHCLYNQEVQTSPQSPTPIAALIERSLGDPAAYERISTRSHLPAIAAASEVLLPATEVVRSLDELRACTGRIGFPAVLKTDRSWGGQGVVIAQNPEQAEKAFRTMSRRPTLLRATKRVLANLDPNLLVRKFVDPAPIISVQRFIRGTLANTSVACWEGEVIAALSVEVVAAYGDLGSSTVLRPVDNPQMKVTAQRIVRHLGVSGFCGLDFILEQETGLAHLLEINPRATQINHLALGAGRDLTGALRAKIAQEPEAPARQLTSAKVIALFPQEWIRDPKSGFLATGYHDVPYDEPALIAALESQPRRDGIKRKMPGDRSWRSLASLEIDIHRPPTTYRTHSRHPAGP
jgi:Carbamoyl-phosphate synthase L chain, ATP binding domain